MDDWIWGYLLGRKRERQRIARAAMPLHVMPGRPWLTLTWRGLRRLLVWALTLLILLALLFLVFAVVYGIRHHLIYMTG